LLNVQKLAKVSPYVIHKLSSLVANVRGVDSFIATGDPLLTSISNLRKERKKERKSKVHVQGVLYIAQGLTLEND
jgi:hypothetical protein